MVGKMKDETAGVAVSLNNKCLRHSMDRIQSKNHKIETYEINNKKIYHAFMTIHILNNRYDRLDLV